MTEARVAGLRPCPGCGATEHRERVAVGKSDLRGDALRLATCVRCGLTFQLSVPTTEALAAWYDYVGHVGASERPSGLLARRIRRLLRDLERYRHRGRLLDVGCGRGTVALVAADLGWEVSATEISASCVGQLRPVLGSRLYNGSLLDAPFDPGSFDVVLMIEVLEHLDDPAGYVRAARDLLRSGGACS